MPEECGGWSKAVTGLRAGIAVAPRLDDHQYDTNTRYTKHCTLLWVPRSKSAEDTSIWDLGPVKSARSAHFRSYQAYIAQVAEDKIKESVNPFTTGNPFLGTKLLGFSIGEGFGSSKRVKCACSGLSRDALKSGYPLHIIFIDRQEKMPAVWDLLHSSASTRSTRRKDPHPSVNLPWKPGIYPERSLTNAEGAAREAVHECAHR